MAGFTFSAGHVASAGYDHVREDELTEGETYYKHSSLENITFKDLTVTGQFESKLYLENCTNNNITFENCTFTGATDDGSNAAIKFLADNQYFTSITVKGCVIDGYYQGVYIQDVNGAVIRNNQISNTGHNAIALQSHTLAATGSVFVEENYLKNVADRAIRLNAVASDANIHMNNNIMVKCGDDEGQLIKVGTVENGATIDLECNYWDGKDVSTAVVGLTAPEIVGITGGSWDMDVDAYRAEVVATIGTTNYYSLQKALENKGIEVSEGETVEVVVVTYLETEVKDADFSALEKEDTPVVTVEINLYYDLVATTNKTDKNQLNANNSVTLSKRNKIENPESVTLNFCLPADLLDAEALKAAGKVLYLKHPKGNGVIRYHEATLIDGEEWDNIIFVNEHGFSEFILMVGDKVPADLIPATSGKGEAEKAPGKEEVKKEPIEVHIAEPITPPSAAVAPAPTGDSANIVGFGLTMIACAAAIVLFARRRVNK